LVHLGAKKQCTSAASAALPVDKPAVNANHSHPLAFSRIVMLLRPVAVLLGRTLSPSACSYGAENPAVGANAADRWLAQRA